MLALTRQNVPTLDRSKMAPAGELRRGAYVLTETKGKSLDVILIANGSELHLAVAAQPELEKDGWAVRVVSMPSFELFAEQEPIYRDSVLPPSVTKRLAIEAGGSLCWHKWVGPGGDFIGIDGFGVSGLGNQLFEHFGFSVENVLARARRLLTAST